MNLIDLFYVLLFMVIWLGFVLTLIKVIREKNYRAFFKILIIPFYVFYYLYHLPETQQKKILVIMTIGCFWLFLFVGILKIVFTPPA